MQIKVGQVWVDNKGRTLEILDTDSSDTRVDITFLGVGGTYHTDGLFQFLSNRGFRLTKKSIIQEFFNNL